jgi:hypothetical protein
LRASAARIGTSNGSDRPRCVWESGPDGGKPVSLLLFDRLGAGTPAAALTRDLRSLRYRLHFDRIAASNQNAYGRREAGCTVVALTSYMIVKLPDGRYRLYSLKVDPRTGRPRNLGTFRTLEEAERRERQVQFFKHRSAHGGIHPRSSGRG